MLDIVRFFRTKLSINKNYYILKYGLEDLEKTIHEFRTNFKNQRKGSENKC
jgi:hypothetical protein